MNMEYVCHVSGCKSTAPFACGHYEFCTPACSSYPEGVVKRRYNGGNDAYDIRTSGQEWKHLNRGKRQKYAEQLLSMPQAHPNWGRRGS